MTADVSRLIFNDPVGGSASAARTVTLRNTGDRTLTIGSLSLGGASPGQFRMLSSPVSLSPGGSTTVRVTFAPTRLGPGGANLVIRSNAANTPTRTVTLRGLGTRGLQGANEPSLQWILDTYQIPVVVGDSSPSEATLDLPARTPNDEVVAQMFRKAGSGNVTLTPIAIFSNPATPGAIAGHYRTDAAGNVTRTQLFTVPSADVQTLNPRTQGTTSFDPGSGAFGLYTTWPAQGNRTVYTEDFRNTFISPASRQRMFRAYPLRNADGSRVANAYVIGNEEAFNNDLQDGVFIIRNVVPLAVGAPSPGTTPSTPRTGTTFQAENAVLVGPTRASSNSGFTGTGYADFTNNSGDIIRWTVNAVITGTKVLTIRYANGGTTDRPLELRVNGAVIRSRLSFAPTGLWTTWRTITLNTGMFAGANSVELRTIGVSGPNIDWLSVAAA